MDQIIPDAKPTQKIEKMDREKLSKQENGKVIVRIFPSPLEKVRRPITKNVTGEQIASTADREVEKKPFTGKIRDIYDKGGT